MDFKDEAKYCPISITQNVLMGKWKLVILWIISLQTRRFNELQRLMPNITRGVLTRQPREMERDGLVHREVYREIPPKVEYSLTGIGSSFIPVMMQIMEWGAGYVKKTANCNMDMDMDICISNKFSCQRCFELIKATNTKKVQQVDNYE